MWGIAFELITVCAIGGSVVYLRLVGSSEKPQQQRSWHAIMIGFLLVLLGSIAKLIVDVPSQGVPHALEDTLYTRFLQT